MKFNKVQWTYENKWAKKIKAINLLGGKCEECGNSSIFVLEFHHLQDKENGLSRLINGRWSEIEREMKKCKLLCSNCHAEFHCNLEERQSKLKNNLLIEIQRLKCEKCGYRGKNLASLDFHHKEKEDKKFVISSVINRNISVPVQDLYNEIEKCEVVCRNCHREQHIDTKRFYDSQKSMDKMFFEIREKQKPIDKNVVRKMLEDNYKQIEIARKLGCCKSTICEIIKRNCFKKNL